MKRGLLKYILGLALFIAASAHAGGPMSVCSGVPTKYSGAGSVTLNYDKNALGSRSKAQADALVTEAVSLWTNVGTATVTLARGSDLSVDVTTANYSTYIGDGTYGDGLNPVVYDTDGSIIDLLNGVGAKNSILGFAGSAWYIYPTYCQYAEGRAVINGYISVSDTTMKTVLAHEIGHLIGLDHTQLDSTQGLSASSPSNYPLMYPQAYRGYVSLHEDDAAAVSALYPDASLSSVYGQLSGTFTQAGGTPIRGANLWAKETSTNKLYSIVSDYLKQNSGYFKLLLPAGTYTLHAEAVQTNFTAGSSVGPYSEALSDPSFQPPLYGSANGGGSAMTPVTLGNGTPTQIVISAGCAATVGFKLDGTGTVGGNCSPACSFTLSSTSQSAAAAGMGGTISVSSTSGCAWTASSNASWITLSSGASGSGNGTVAYSVAANASASSRTGTLTIAGQTFTVTQSGSSGGATTNQLGNPGFESGGSTWTQAPGGIITNSATWTAHAGSYYARLGGYDSGTDWLYQNVTIPASAQTATVQFWYRIATQEVTSSIAYDVMQVELYNVGTGAKLATLATYSNLNATTGWVQSSQFDVSAYKGLTVQLRFTAIGDVSLPTSFLIDDVSLATPTCSGVADADNDGIPDCVEPGEGKNPMAKDNAVFTNARLFAMQQYRDFLAREGDSGGIATWTNYITSGTYTRAQAINSFFSAPEFGGVVPSVARLYFSYFMRIPDYAGLTYWLGRYRAGLPLSSISNTFATSSEFVATYGALNNGQFVTLVYNNVLGRAPDTAGYNYWLSQLNGGAMTRGQVMLGFSESAEYQSRIYNSVYVTMMYVGMLRRSPDQGGFNAWVANLNGGMSGLNLINGFIAAPEYYGRFL